MFVVNFGSLHPDLPLPRAQATFVPLQTTNNIPMCCSSQALSGQANQSGSSLSLADEDPAGAELLAKLAHLLACLATETMDSLKKVENGECRDTHVHTCPPAAGLDKVEDERGWALHCYVQRVTG